MPITKKTDNSHVIEKVELRLNHLPKKQSIKILDVCHGYGEIWKKIKTKTDKEFDVTGLEKRTIKQRNTLVGDNLKIIPSLDLSVFDIIDIDVYGSPAKQFEAIIKNGTYKKDVYFFMTYIQRGFGCIDKVILKSCGYTDKMIKKIKSIFHKKPFEKLKIYLYNKGIRKIYRYGNDRTNYIFFKINPEWETEGKM